MNDNRETCWRVGELARASGLTVRTLHYYDEIGLLVCSERTESGHRLYSGADVRRLYRISLLRRLGLPLTEIGRALDDPEWSLPAAFTGTWASWTAGSPWALSYGSGWRR